MTGPVRMDILATWSCPKTACRKGNPRKEEWRTKRPDADNVAKAICDALNGVAFDDDSQVVDLCVMKRQAAQGLPPDVIVVISEITSMKGDR